MGTLNLTKEDNMWFLRDAEGEQLAIDRDFMTTHKGWVIHHKEPGAEPVWWYDEENDVYYL